MGRIGTVALPRSPCAACWRKAACRPAATRFDKQVSVSLACRSENAHLQGEEAGAAPCQLAAVAAATPVIAAATPHPCPLPPASLVSSCSAAVRPHRKGKQTPRLSIGAYVGALLLRSGGAAVANRQSQEHTGRDALALQSPNRRYPQDHAVFVAVRACLTLAASRPASPRASCGRFAESGRWPPHLLGHETSGQMSAL